MDYNVNNTNNYFFDPQSNKSQFTNLHQLTTEANSALQNVHAQFIAPEENTIESINSEQSANEVQNGTILYKLMTDQGYVNQLSQQLESKYGENPVTIIDNYLNAKNSGQPAQIPTTILAHINALSGYKFSTPEEANTSTLIFSFLAYRTNINDFASAFGCNEPPLDMQSLEDAYQKYGNDFSKVFSNPVAQNYLDQVGSAEMNPVATQMPNPPNACPPSPSQQTALETAQSNLSKNQPLYTSAEATINASLATLNQQPNLSEFQQEALGQAEAILNESGSSVNLTDLQNIAAKLEQAAQASSPSF